MKHKRIIIFILFIFIGGIVLLFSIKNQSETNINIVEINDIKETLKENWDTLDSNHLPGLEYGLDYVVLDQHHQVIVQTRQGLNTNLNVAISNRDTIVDITKEDVVLGKLIIYNNSDELFAEYRTMILILSILIIFFIVTISILYNLYLNKRILKPFHKLQAFAHQVALGKLDMPLEMDKGNLFGAFTESFDLMREELKKARENERLANQSKKELVASLSHDIKTPVASIKAVSEIMRAKTESEYDKKQLEVINSKADQINTLITNMFDATLEELQELKVEVSEESSLLILDLIKNADYNHQVKITKTAECIVYMDVLRLSQVIDNVISNSYKYANTKIDVSISIKEDFLIIEFKDFGKGVSLDDIPLIFNKFYRGKNGEGKSGTGLGLYISKYLMNKMSGDITCENTSDGFLIRIKLAIV